MNHGDPQSVHLKLLATTAHTYALARVHVYDVENPGADPSTRSPDQRRMISRIEDTQADPSAQPSAGRTPLHRGP
jgi:hypothetical protein